MTVLLVLGFFAFFLCVDHFISGKRHKPGPKLPIKRMPETMSYKEWVAFDPHEGEADCQKQLRK